MGVVGLLAWLWLLPGNLPEDAFAWQNEATVEAQARGVLDALGAAPLASTKASVDAVRDPLLLDSMQARWGRHATVERLSADADAAPAHLWRVRWATRPALRAERTLDAAPRTVWLDRRGRIAGLDLVGIAPDSIRRDTLALRAALGFAPLAAPTDGGTAARLAARGPPGTTPGAALGRLPADSILRPARFDLADDAPPVPETAPAVTARAVPAPAAAEVAVRFDADAAARMAVSHLARSAYASLDFATDSVRLSDRPGTGAARVYLSSRGGDAVSQWARVEVTPGGALIGLAVAARPHDGPKTAFTASDIRGYVAIGSVVLLALVLVALFVRRLAARQVDVRGSMRDGLLGALLGGGWFFCTASLPILDASPSTFSGVLVVAINVLLTSLVLGVVVMSASGVSERLSRPRFPEKFTALALLRRGALHDVRVSRALLRGTCAALLFLGMFAVLLQGLPDVRIGVPSSDEPRFAHALYVSVIGAATTLPLVLGFFVVLGAIVPIAASAHRREVWRWPAYIAATLVSALVMSSFSELSEPYGALAALALAATAVWLFARHDALTAVTALAVVHMLWLLHETWVVRGIPSFFDGMIGFGIVGVLLLVGVAGTVWAREVASEAALVPEYLREREREARDRRELEIARNVQTHFLPARMPQVPGVEFGATCVPAQDVGGDLYDFIPLDDGRIGIVVGDVSGKGIQAAFVMTLVKGFLQALGREHASPKALLARLNGLFRANVPRGAFITLVYGLLDAEAGTFTFGRAGHTPLLVRSRDGKTRLIQPPGPAIGLAPDAIFAGALVEETLVLADGDTLVFYTDGFSEAMNPRHDLYGDDRLCEQVAALDTVASADALIATLVADVRLFAGEAEQHDDMTMVVVRYRAGAATTTATVSGAGT